MAAHKARRQMPPPAPTPPLTEIVMIDETKGENEKDVSFEGAPISHRPKEPTK